MWNHHLVVWFPESLEEHGEGRPWKSIQGSSSRIVKLAVGTLGQGLLGRCYFVSLFLLLQHTPLSSTPSLFLQHLNKNKPWICPVRCFLSLLFAYGGGSSGRTTEFPNLPLRTCSLSSEVERSVIFSIAPSREGRVCQGPATELWNPLPFMAAAFLLLILFTRTGSRQGFWGFWPFYLKSFFS